MIGRVCVCVYIYMFAPWFKKLWTDLDDFFYDLKSTENNRLTLYEIDPDGFTKLGIFLNFENVAFITLKS